MKVITHPDLDGHNTEESIENNERLDLVRSLYQDRNFEFVKAENGSPLLESFHTPEYIRKIKDICSKLDPSNEETEAIDEAQETLVSHLSYRAACYAAGAAALAAEYASLAENAFALVRPPGHHARPDYGAGFCIFNNMAIAATHITSLADERVLIVDLDLHRGGGTEAAAGENIFYFSMHQEGSFDGTEFDEYEGNIRNVVIKANTPEEDYIKRMTHKLEGIIKTFRPTLIGISAGFDTFGTDKDERIGNNLDLSGKVYHALLDQTAPIPFFAVLEGGYNSKSIQEGLYAFNDWTMPETQS